MVRWLLVLVLTVASATAWAQSVPPATVTARAQGAVVDAERRVNGEMARRNELAQRFYVERDAAESLKKEKASWRRDRELKEQLAKAQDLGDQLRVLDAGLARAQSDLLVARRTYVAAIDAELASNTAAPQRARDLAKLRAQLAPMVGAPVHKIVIPERDFNVDPEEAAVQASALRQVETELQARIDGLDSQVHQLESKSTLKDAHDRTHQMDAREDNNSQRTTQSPTRTTGLGDAASQPPPSNPELVHSPEGAAMFNMDTVTALGNVISNNDLESFARAVDSKDPKQRLAALKKLREQIDARKADVRRDRQRLESLSKHR